MMGSLSSSLMTEQEVILYFTALKCVLIHTVYIVGLVLGVSGEVANKVLLCCKINNMKIKNIKVFNFVLFVLTLSRTGGVFPSTARGSI